MSRTEVCAVAKGCQEGTLIGAPRSSRLFGVLLAAAFVATGWSAAGNELTSIRYSDSPHFSRVVFDLTEPPRYKSDLLQNPPRFYVDLLGTRTATQFRRPAMDSEQFKNVRIATRGDATRVVLDLYETKQPKLLILRPNGKSGHRLVIDFPNEVEEVCALEHDRNVVIVLDPGHGGEDPGAIAVNRVLEKDIVLSIAKLIRDQIEAQPGFKVVMTRERDHELMLKSRYQLAQNVKARLFVSIHADAFHNPRPRGASAFVLSEGKAKSELASWLVENENRADWVGGVSAWVDSGCHEARDKLKFLNVKVRQEALADAVDIGKKMLRSIDMVADIHPKSFNNKRGEYQVTDAGFVVLKATAIPSLLVETGFLSNPQEAKLLATRAYQAKIASAIGNTILTHFCEHPPRYTDLAEGKVSCDLPPSTVVYKVQRGDSLSLIAMRQKTSVAAIRQANALKSDNIYIGQTLTIPIAN